MFRRLRGAVVLGTLATLCANATAVVPGSQTYRDAPAVTALASAGITKPLRTHKQLVWGQSAPARVWTDFQTRRPGTWNAAWDRATGVPSRIYGEGIPAPGSITNAFVAESFARQVLADHIALLAPGSAVADFELVSNHLADGMRTIGFVQRARGLRVIGGQVSFRFKADRLFVIGSEALPNVAFVSPRSRMLPTTIRERATVQLRAELGLPASAPVSAIGDEVILPLVADDTILSYRVVRALEIDGGGDGRYRAYADVATGAVIAVEQLNLFAAGTVKYRAVDRYPAKPRVDRIAQRAFVEVNGAPQTTMMTGGISWSDGDVEVSTSVIGDLVSVVNKAEGNVLATAVLPMSPGGTVIWDATGSPVDDAQVNAYIATMRAKEYVRDFIDPTMPTLDEQMTVNVNIAQSCNAYFDGALNFYRANDQCQNTALLEDVVYHEYGHRLHTAVLIPGVADFDRAMSEGAADFLAASMTGDPGMGRGFFYLDNALRELDPSDSEWTWPRDVGEIHRTGQIYAGIFWDLRKDLITQFGEATAVQIVNKLYLGTMRRAINIPSSLVEALAEDDNDGNLANGTPHECAIRDAFGRHGIRTATGTIKAPGQLTVNALAVGVHLDVSGLSDGCVGDEVAGADITWLQGFGGVPAGGTAEATPAGLNTWFAQLPLSPNQSVYYKARIKFTDGTVLTLADNYADPYYQLYQGETVKLYCTNFDTTDPFSEGWTTGTNTGAESPFQWGEPTFGGSTDPHAAYSGDKILGMSLGGNYHPDEQAWLKSPKIDVGRYSDVHLHYRRWLAVEDSFFDQAMITANDKKTWMNFSSDMGNDSALHHIDKEWRFHDVPLSGYFSGHEVTVQWDITSDSGLELGGWHMDDVCIVANPNAICGDGVKTPTEQCDTGASNADRPDVCRTDCRLPKCGDGIIDAIEECDGGPDGDPLCTPQCTLVEIPGGCCSTTRGSSGALFLGGLVGLALFGRRRRTRR